MSYSCQVWLALPDPRPIRRTRKSFVDREPLAKKIKRKTPREFRRKIRSELLVWTGSRDGDANVRHFNGAV